MSRKSTRLIPATVATVIRHTTSPSGSPSYALVLESPDHGRQIHLTAPNSACAYSVSESMVGNRYVFDVSYATGKIHGFIPDSTA